MKQLACGIDIGGTKLAIGLMRPDGDLARVTERTDHVRLSEAELMDMIAAIVVELCDKEGMRPPDLTGIGVGMAGHIRGRDGVVITTSNLSGFKNYPLTRELSSRLGARVLLDNDANCQALAEHRFGAGRGYEDMVFVTVSTGIGAGIIINNRLYRGQSGTAGEFGHTIIEPGSECVCTCGNKGCFMAHACTLNLDGLVRRKSGRHTDSGLLKRVRIDGKVVVEHAGMNDPLALEVMNEYADYLGILAYNIFQIFNPPAIIFGGGLMNWGEPFFERLRERFHHLARGMLHDPIVILKALLDKRGGILGAASLGRDA